jgi:hypothetical protein
LRLRALQFGDVNIRDKRTIREQINSGFRLAGWILLTFALFVVLLGSAFLLTAQGGNPTVFHRFLGICGLVSIATAMFFSVRYWAQWFVGLLGYLIFKTAISILLGRTPSVPSIVRPRLVILEYLVTSVAAMWLCFRYSSRVPRRIETLGLIGLVISFAFAIVYDSPVPVLIGLSLLGSAQLVEYWWRQYLLKPRHSH